MFVKAGPHPGFMWILPKIRVSPNFRATAQANAVCGAGFSEASRACPTVFLKNSRWPHCRCALGHLRYASENPSAVAAPYDSFDGYPPLTQKDHFPSRRSTRPRRDLDRSISVKCSHGDAEARSCRVAELQSCNCARPENYFPDSSTETRSRLTFRTDTSRSQRRSNMSDRLVEPRNTRNTRKPWPSHSLDDLQPTSSALCHHTHISRLRTDRRMVSCGSRY